MNTDSQAMPELTLDDIIDDRINNDECVDSENSITDTSFVNSADSHKNKTHTDIMKLCEQFLDRHFNVHDHNPPHTQFENLSEMLLIVNSRRNEIIRYMGALYDNQEYLQTSDIVEQNNQSPIIEFLNMHFSLNDCYLNPGFTQDELDAVLDVLQQRCIQMTELYESINARRFECVKRVYTYILNSSHDNIVNIQTTIKDDPQLDSDKTSSCDTTNVKDDPQLDSDKTSSCSITNVKESQDGYITRAHTSANMNTNVNVSTKAYAGSYLQSYSQSQPHSYVQTDSINRSRESDTSDQKMIKTSRFDGYVTTGSSTVGYIVSGTAEKPYARSEMTDKGYIKHR